MPAVNCPTRTEVFFWRSKEGWQPAAGWQYIGQPALQNYGRLIVGHGPAPQAFQVSILGKLSGIGIGSCVRDLYQCGGDMGGALKPT